MIIMDRDEFVCECGHNTFFIIRECNKYYMKCIVCSKHKEITYWMDEDGNVEIVFIGD